MTNFRQKGGVLYKQVFCKYIIRDGRRIYPRKAKVFKFWVPVG